MNTDEFLKFMQIKTEDEMLEYSQNYLTGKYSFDTVMHEIAFLYNLGLFLSDHYSSANTPGSKEHLEYIFRNDDKYYYPIYFYLKAVKLYEVNKEKIDQYPDFIYETVRRCYVNLGNEFSNQFRTMSALPYFRKAIQLDPEFDMAIGNYALCIEHHSPLVGYDRCDKVFNLLLELYRQVRIDHLDSGQELFQHKQIGYIMQQQRYIREITIGNDPQYDPYGYFEKIFYDDTFEDWCVSRMLYLNYINDIDDFAEAAFDIDLDALAPQLQLTQACGRLLRNMVDLFAHNRKKLFDCQDINVYTNQLELISIFNALYSFFDKTAYFLYMFFQLCIKDEREVSIASIWRLKTGQGNALLDYKNQYLYNIYWLRKEYRDKPNKDFNVNELFSPDAHEYAELRNIFDHRGTFNLSDDNALRRIDPSDLYQKTTRLARTARELILSIIQMVRTERKLVHPKTGIRDLDLIYFEYEGFVPSNPSKMSLDT